MKKFVDFNALMAALLATVLLAGCAQLPPPVVTPPPPVVVTPPVVMVPPPPVVEPAPEPEPPPIPRATLAIVTRDAVTRRDVAGAHVSLHTGEEADTNDAGYAPFPDLILGGRGVLITAAGYHERFYSVDVFDSNLQIEVLLEPIPLPAVMPWTGALKLAPNSLGFVDGAGAWQLPVCAHFMEAFSAYTRRPAEVEAQLRGIKSAGYDCVRFLDILGYYDSNRPDQSAQWSAWKGREVTPLRFMAYSGRTIDPTPDYYGQLERFVGLAKSIGLTLQHDRGDMNALTFEQVRSHVEQIVPIYDRVGWDALAMMAAANEVWQNGGFSAEQMARMLAPFRARGALVGHSDSDPAEEPAALAAISAGAPIYVVHGLRVGPPSLVMDHIFSLGYFEPRQGVPRLGWQREPTGPGAGVSVGRVEDREQLALMAATALLARQAWNYMCGDCVFWNAPLERNPGFAAVPRIRDAIKAFAADVMAWPTLRHGGRSDAALKSPTGWFGDPGVTDGPGRINQAISADRRRVVGTVTGGRGRKQVQNALGCTLDLTVVSVRDDETIQSDTFTLGPGQSLTVDYRIGRLLLGRCQ